jgi:hypothetical protein
MDTGGKRLEIEGDPHSHPFPRSRMEELYLHSHICLYGIVFKYLSTETKLPYLAII